MNKSEFKKLCERHAVNHHALNRKLVEDGIVRKDATKYQILRCLMIHCTDLLYCRESDFEHEVEYFDRHAPMRLIDEMTRAENETDA